MNREQKRLLRYLRSHGLQQKEIADIMGFKSHQAIGYNVRTMRQAFLDKHLATDSHEGGVKLPLVGQILDPPSPVKLTPKNDHQDHTCPHYCEMAAYAQLEDLDKDQKIAVILSLLEEVEKQ